ncbi:hypothetical protein NHQ30_002931, partial [Ciborinia camelliae]
IMEATITSNRFVKGVVVAISENAGARTINTKTNLSGTNYNCNMQMKDLRVTANQVGLSQEPSNLSDRTPVMRIPARYP